MLHKHGVFPQGAKVVLVPLLLHRGELTPLRGSWSRFGSGFCFCLVSNPKKKHPLMNPEVWDLSTSHHKAAETASEEGREQGHDPGWQ